MDWGLEWHNEVYTNKWYKIGCKTSILKQGVSVGVCNYVEMLILVKLLETCPILK